MTEIIDIPSIPPERQVAPFMRGLIGKGPLRYFEDLMHQEGAFAVFPVPGAGGRPSIMLNDAVSIAHVSGKDYTIKDAPAEFLQLIMGRGILFSDGETWRPQRWAATPFFQPRAINHINILNQMVAATQEMLDRWQPYADQGEPIDLAQEFPRLTFDVLLRALFHETGSERAAEMQAALGIILEEANRRQWMMHKELAEEVYKQSPFAEAAQTLREAADDIASRRRLEMTKDGFEHGKDLLSSLVRYYDSIGPEGQEILRHEVLTYLLAGHETTAHSLAFAHVFLSQNPALQQKMKAEVDGALGMASIDMDSMKSLTYTRNVFQETLRVRPPISLVRRVAPADDLIPLDDGRFISIPKDHYILLAPWAVHRRPVYWENPEVFDPDRFNQTIQRGAYFPFTLGPRQCIGNRFALLEGTVALAEVARRFELSVINPVNVGFHYAITLRPMMEDDPKRPILATIKNRHDPRAAM
jgi:cytochrome P450